ncbi:MAG: serine O-acetyltransferase [Clostridia bacterium]|nr:serine O-acetyltransferase [Clostridia bacterium]
MKVCEFFELLKDDIKKDVKEESREWKKAIDELIELILNSLKKEKRRFKKAVSQTKLIREVEDTLDAYMKRDPAAKSKLEVLLLYPGVHAILAHRIAHKLYKKGYNFSARAISQISRLYTGIEIHPGATIGKRFVIDHGMGVVIGETAIIGDDVLVYQGVTLGGSGKEKKKRHPTIENGVMVGCGAKVLGSFTVGEGSRVASNAVVLNEIPKEATAVGIPAKVVRIKGEKPEETLDHVHIPDPISAELDKLRKRIDQLEKALGANSEPKTEQINDSTLSDKTKLNR